jgi:hypothetical protein
MSDFTRREVLRLGGLAFGSAVVGPSLLGCDLRFRGPPLLSLVRPEPDLAVAERPATPSTWSCATATWAAAPSSTATSRSTRTRA